jgi:Tfp pilus assembly protein PilF
MEYSADFAASRHNLGNYYANLGDPEQALNNYKQAIRIDDMFYPAKVNMAMLFNQLGENDNAEILLRDVVRNHPEVIDAFYSLGLLLAEQKKYEEALHYLDKASELMPYYARIHYNKGLLLNMVGKTRDAELSLLKTLEIEPDNYDYIYAVADFYLKQENWKRAKIYAEQLRDKFPSSPIGQDLITLIDRYSTE